MSLVSRA